MTTGADILEALREHDLDFAKEVHPYDRRRIEETIDGLLGEEDRVERVDAEDERDRVLDALGSDLKTRFRDWATDIVNDTVIPRIAERLVDNFAEFVDDAIYDVTKAHR